MTDITAQAPDGTLLTFPTGTADDVVDRTMKQYIAGGHQQAPQQASAQPPQAQPDPSVWNDIKGGAHDVMTGLGATAHVAGQVANAHGYTGFGSGAETAGKWLTDNAPTDAEAGNTPGQRLANDIRNRDVGNGAGDLGHAMVRTGVTTAPGLVLGAIPTVGPALAGAYFGGMNAGSNVQAVAANNGNTGTPTDAEVGQGLLATVPDVAAGTLLSKAGRLTEGFNPLARTAARTGIDATAGGAMTAGNEIGTSVGTEKGLQMDPAAIAAGAVTQGAIGGSIAGRKALGDAVKTGTDHLVARTMDAPSDPESVLRAKQLIDQRMKTGDNNSGKPLTPMDAANSVKSDLANAAQTFVRLARRNGMDPIDAGASAELINQVRRANNTSSMDAGSLRARLENMDFGNMPEEQVQAFKENIADLNTLAPASRINRSTGILEKTGSIVGKGLGLLSAARSMNPLAIAGAVAGMPLEGRLGGAIGALGDRMLGSNNTSIAYQSINARRALKAAGVDPDSIRGAIPQYSGPEATPAPEAPVDPMANLSQGQQAAYKGMARTLAKNGPTDPEAQAAHEALTQAGLHDMVQNALDEHKTNEPIRAARAAVEASQALLPQDAIGAQQAAASQAALLAKYGPDHPIGATAAQALDASGQTKLLQQAMGRWNANAPIRATVEAMAAKQGSEAEAAKQAKNDATAETKRAAQVRRGNAAAVFDQQAQDARTQERGNTLTEQAANKLSGEIYRRGRANRAAQQEADPETGLPPSPTPVDVPLTSKGLPKFSPNTPADVLTTLAADNAGSVFRPGDPATRETDAGRHDLFWRQVAAEAERGVAQMKGAAAMEDLTPDVRAQVEEQQQRIAKANEQLTTKKTFVDGSVYDGSPAEEATSQPAPVEQAPQPDHPAVVKKAKRGARAGKKVAQAAASPSEAPTAASEPTPAPTPAEPATDASGTTSRPLWSQMVSRGLGGIDHATAVAALKEAGKSGALPQKFVDDVLKAPANSYIDGKLLDPAHQIALKMAYGELGGKSAKGSGVIHNPISYAHNVAQEADAYATVVARGDADMRSVADDIRNAVLNGKTAEGRKAILSAHLSATLDASRRAEMARLLMPLTGYGKK